ncbi:hypothetical protein J437_LFUL017658 [Ladona fulva]|uniref:Reverse transcriptase domain-containing protein n=1 Tax=Ladona fulva TaxID=123851 RepID=A0A8K0KNT3_LADFU|nr:hypothetical protein J437_LFUL017658 [Ladona fulva]
MTGQSRWRSSHRNSEKYPLSYHHTSHFKSLEIIGISLNINNSSYIVYSTYIPCQSKTALNELRHFILNQSNFLINGDINSKNPYWGSNTTNQNGRRLYRVITQNHLTIHSPFAPTHHNKNNSFDLLDFGLSKNQHNISHPLVLNSLGSDHFPVLFSIYSNISLFRPNPAYHINWNKYSEFLCNKPNLITPTAPNPKDINSQISKLNQLIFEAKTFSHTPLITLRNQKIRAFHSYRNPLDKAEWKRPNKEIHLEIRAYKNQNWLKKINDLEFADNSLWRMAKALKSATINPFPLLSDNLLHFDPNGVPQGAILSPTLFNIYLYDFPKTPSTQTYIYADDVTITAQSRSPNAAMKWNLQINPNKCAHINLNKLPSKQLTLSTKYLNSIIPTVKNHKFLGVHLDIHLNWKNHARLTLQFTLQVREERSTKVKTKLDVRGETKVHIQVCMHQFSDSKEAARRPKISSGFLVERRMQGSQ